MQSGFNALVMTDSVFQVVCALKRRQPVGEQLRL